MGVQFFSIYFSNGTNYILLFLVMHRKIIIKDWTSHLLLCPLYKIRVHGSSIFFRDKDEILSISNQTAKLVLMIDQFHTTKRNFKIIKGLRYFFSCITLVFPHAIHLNTIFSCIHFVPYIL
jgi:hypothetical protein